MATTKQKKVIVKPIVTTIPVAIATIGSCDIELTASELCELLDTLNRLANKLGLDW